MKEALSYEDSVVTSFDVIKTVVINKDGTLVDESINSDEFTIYPGASTTINLMSRILRDGVVVCEEKFTNVTSVFEPKLNSAGIPTVLQSTNFADPESDGEVVYGYDHLANPMVFAIWDPSISKYTITASGTGCADYKKDLQHGTFYTRIKPRGLAPWM